jgi:hypothetical protein
MKVTTFVLLSSVVDDAVRAEIDRCDIIADAIR